ncbi:MAG: anhydro-N-acetylmuramic acid kinase [Saprospiraceae bacterium]|nr:anhydro-N-acetylmuramic acid kinase [Saprospiraceae bacterium]HMW38251.1 anhydro-N-acetylmuramic acid kinase [Saprospiraceae bacterium]HMX87446.1 anhydro-N-acetylmuramic acid kinase [Saprospiraceae bacterium]HMZ39273.1 anhydro-N-acetylmuramic acid kinase [Saprospiraceae bacterium]HNA63434.1 anhydro-N-acetylmuramic acid kinase [Saprospiraceae bacterium]
MNPLKPDDIILGLMSGTSLDGLDLCACTFSQKTNQEALDYRILCADTVSYPAKWHQILLNSFYSSMDELSRLNTQFGIYLAEQINFFCKKNKIQPALIGSHGHTVFHRPDQGITLQIGHGSIIRKMTGIPVISNFRMQDVQLGGQGAPLVPIGDRLLFRDYAFCLNLGGFSNISWDSNGKRKACDIAPCNMLLNQLASRENLAYDKDGILASCGRMIDNFLEKWNQLPYYSMGEPKSLGREWFEKNWNHVIGSNEWETTDLLRTATEHIAMQIVSWILRSGIRSNQKILVTGGGAYNKFLIERLSLLLAGEITLHIPEAMLIDYKEAMIFGLLAYLRYHGKINILSSVTGSPYDQCSGDIYL